MVLMATHVSRLPCYFCGNKIEGSRRYMMTRGRSLVALHHECYAACAFCRTPICETSWRAFLAGGPPPDDDKWYRVHHKCADPMKSVLRLLYSSIGEDLMPGWTEREGTRRS